MKQLILPSIIAKSQSELDAKLRRFQGAVKTLHLDIVDGRFAPNKSLEFSFTLQKKFQYQTHLMVKDPEKWIQKQINNSSINLFIPHFEAIDYPSRYLLWMKQLKKKTAVAILPETTVGHLQEHLPHLNYVLILTVHPGFYGSQYLPSELQKIKLIKKVNPNVKVIVDGGMNLTTIKEAAKAGADLFVTGSYLNNYQPKKAMAELLRAIKNPNRSRAAGYSIS